MTLPRLLAASALALTFLFGGSALAQEGPGDGPPPEDRAEIEQRIQMMRVYALTEALELDEETATRLFPYLRPGDAKMKELHEKQRATKRTLRKLVKSGEVDDATLDELVGTMAELEVELTQEREKQFLGLKAILTPQQRAAFFVAQERFDREMRRRLREIRRGRKGDRSRHRGEDRH